MPEKFELLFASCVDYLDRHTSQLVQFAQDLVRINSVHGNEVEIATCIKQHLSKRGISARLIGRDRMRKTLVAEVGRGRPVIVLNGHLDTVSLGNPEQWRFPPLSAKIVGDRMYGRGTMDMKCAVAAAVYSALALHPCRKALRGTLRLVFNFDEEGGVHSGILDYLARNYSADAAIVGEPMYEKSIRIGARGVYRFELTTHGKSAHTAYPGGINAVTHMAKLLLALEKLRPRYKRHALFPAPIITPGTVIEAGSSINIIPDSCRALVDCRLTYGQSKASIVEDIERCLLTEKKRTPSLSYSFKELVYLPPALTAKREAIVKSSIRAVEEVLGYKPELTVGGGASDGNLLIEAGIPCAIFGVRGKGMHAENEYASIKSMFQAAKMNSYAVLDYLHNRA